MQSSLAFYEAMLLAMGLLSMAMKYFLMPGVEIYFFLSVINQMAGHRFSKMVDLIGSILRMSIRILFAAMIGYQGIQGLLVPVRGKGDARCGKYSGQCDGYRIWKRSVN